MAFSVYEVVYVACLSRGWFVYVTGRSHARERPLDAGQSDRIWFQKKELTRIFGITFVILSSGMLAQSA